MSTRVQKVEQMLRREIAELLLRGELRDPRIQPIAAISVTGVRVSPDLGTARVFVDGLGDAVDFPRLLAGLNAGAGALRAAIGARSRLRRTPRLRFERDQSVDQGRTIERVLSELALAQPSVAAPTSTGDEPEDEPDDDEPDDDEPDDDEPDDDSEPTELADGSTEDGPARSGG